MDWVTWVNTGVGIIGIIVGIIGCKSLSAAIKIKNDIKADTVQQAQIIHNGLDDYAVIRLSQETTKEELQKIIDNFRPVMWEEIDDVPERVQQTEKQVKELSAKVDDIPTMNDVQQYIADNTASNEEIDQMLDEVFNCPRILVGDEEPENPREGEFSLN